MPKNNAINSIVLILIFIIITDTSILLNIPFFRPILGFIFLIFLPGFLLINVFKLDNLGYTEKFVLSVGLSTSLIMLIGIIINTLYPSFDYDTPLSLISLVISLSFVSLILALAAHYRGGLTLITRLNYPMFDTGEKAFFIIPLLFIPLSVLGMRLMNATDNNAMLMALLFMIPIYVIVISLFHNHIPRSGYPITIFLSSVSLVLLMGMRSNHIIGADTHMEYFIFLQTMSAEKWQIFIRDTLDSCLSISILPTIYQSFLNVNPEYLFKVLYPIIFSISPLVIYCITKNYLGEIYAFLASVFLMSQNTFLETTANSRTTIAILFFALSIMVLLDNKLPMFEKRLMLIIFIFSCVVSHYGTTYIFFAIFLSLFILTQIIFRIIGRQEKTIPDTISPKQDENKFNLKTDTIIHDISKTCLTPSLLIIFFLMIFIWYSQITGVAFDGGIGFIVDTIKSLQSFFVLESRQGDVAAALGSGAEELELPSKISFVFRWLTIIFTAIGVFSSLYIYYKFSGQSTWKADRSHCLLTKRIDIIFLFLSIICSAIIAIFAALPFASIGYGIYRVYLLTNVVLAPFFVLGGITVAWLFRIRWKYLVVLAVLIPFFLCTTGMMYQLFEYPSSISLNSRGNDFDRFYIYDKESFAIKWLGMSIDQESKVYSDYFDGRKLISQGLKNSSAYMDFVVDMMKADNYIKDGYVYLRHKAVVNGVLYGNDGYLYNTSDYQEKFNAWELIYANGGSKVFLPSVIG